MLNFKPNQRGYTMNRNVGKTQTFGVKFPREQAVPVKFAYVRKNGTGELRDFTITVKTEDLEAVAKNGSDVHDAYIFGQVVLQHIPDAVHANANKINLATEYRQVKLNQTFTRIHCKGYFSSGNVQKNATVDKQTESVAQAAE